MVPKAQCAFNTVGVGLQLKIGVHFLRGETRDVGVMSFWTRFPIVSAPLTVFHLPGPATTLGANPALFPLALSLALPGIAYGALRQCQ